MSVRRGPFPSSTKLPNFLLHNFFSRHVCSQLHLTQLPSPWKCIDFILSKNPLLLMALISFPRFLSRPLESNHRRSLRSRHKCVCCVSPTAAATSKGRSGSAVIWFKQDLRVDDHLGLVAASKYQAVVPLYVFDHRILSRKWVYFLFFLFFICFHYRVLKFGFCKDKGRFLPATAWVL